MKLTKLLPAILISFLISENVKSQDTNIVKYFPLKIGNVWVYSWLSQNPPSYGRYKVAVTSSFVANGKRYFDFSFIPNSGCSVFLGYYVYSFRPLRIDSINGNIYSYVPANGCSYSPDIKMVDSLFSRPGDIERVYCGTQPHTCTDTALMNIFGVLRPTKNFYYLITEAGGSRRYAKGIGLINTTSYLNFWNCTHTLTGCVIDGVVYGDTTLTGLTPISTQVPYKFSLSQNYPNPFNPTTKVNFSLPKKSFVRMIIYDALGRAIAELVNQDINPGTYSVDWNAANFPSGIYFYTLLAGDYKETKKMVLLK